MSGARMHSAPSIRGPVILEARVTTLHESDKGVYADIEMDQRSVARQGISGAVLTALQPWLGELLSKGILVYLNHYGRIEVVTDATTLEDLLEADAVEIVVQVDMALPSPQSARQARPGAGEVSESDSDAVFDGYYQPSRGPPDR